MIVVVAIMMVVVVGYWMMIMTTTTTMMRIHRPYTELPVARVEAALLPQVHPPGWPVSVRDVHHLSLYIFCLFMTVTKSSLKIK